MFSTIKKIQTHIACVQQALRVCVDELMNRAFVHDASKLQEDELTGFARFEDMPEGLEYGSEEYQAAMAKVMADNNFFQLHSQRNDHHPEYWDTIETDVGMMGLFSILEMVCDWAGAHLTYGNKGGWQESVEINIKKHPFNTSQKWVIYQMSHFLSRKIPELRDVDY